MSIDHKAEAEKNIGLITRSYNIGTLPAVTVFALAQVQATLALTEQQRIANLIAYTVGTYPNGSGIGHGEGVEQIRKGLGIV